MAKSSSIEAESKLQFYPTHEYETRRILGVLGGYPSLKRNIEKEFKEEYGGEEKHRELFTKYLDMEQQGIKTSFSIFRFNELLNERKYNLIDKYFECILSYSQPVVVADLFAGEGSWLKLFKQISNSGNILIGNELEYNRYNKMIEDGLIDYHYNLPFEELELPKKIINIMLFNPPYGISNSERNVRRYLRMSLDRDLLAPNGIYVFVIKKSDVLDCSDLITQYFNVNNSLVYKTHEEEYNKWKQLVVIASLRDKKLNLDNLNDIAKFKQEQENFIAYVNMEMDFHIDDYNRFRYHSHKIQDVKKAFDDFKYTKVKDKYISHNDKAWKWLKQETEITDLSEEIITIPKNLKSGELANIIASGKINGEISLSDNKARHIVVGGVKTVREEREVKKEDKKGNVLNKIETTIKSVPYLNLLINNNGKLEIKELKVKESEVTSEDDTIH